MGWWLMVTAGTARASLPAQSRAGSRPAGAVQEQLVAETGAGSVAYQTFAVELPGRDGQPLPSGTLRLPTGKGLFAAVVLLPDAPAVCTSTAAQAAAQRLGDALADYLPQQGIAVFRLEARGAGQAESTPGAAGPAELAADAEAALSYLRTRSGIDPVRVGLLGHGVGGNIALLAAAHTPPAFVVALAAAGVTGQQLLAEQWSLVNQPGEPDTARAALARRQSQVMTLAKRQAQKMEKEGTGLAQAEVYLGQQRLRLHSEERKRTEALTKRQLALLEIVHQTPDDAQAQTIVANMLRQQCPALDATGARLRAAQLTAPWYRQFLAFDPQAALPAVKCPVLLLQGADDTTVPAEPNLELLKKGLKANSRVTAKLLPNLDHAFQYAPLYEVTTGFSPPTDAAVLTTIRDWITAEAGK